MLYFKVDARNVVVEVAEESDASGRFVSRLDFRDFATAQRVASEANALENGNVYIATDAGGHCYPRYDVIRKPTVGDKVSYAFNGDSYPDGEIVSVGDGVKMVVKTSKGGTYYRQGESARWIRKGGTFGMVHGWYDRRNPEL